MQYRRTPHLSGYSPSELLNGRHIHTKLDAMVLSLAHVEQGIQAKAAMKSQQQEQKGVKRFPHQYKVGILCFALHIDYGGTRTPDWCLLSSPRLMVQRECMSGSAQEDLFGADTLNS